MSAISLPSWWLEAARLHRRLQVEVPDPAARATMLQALLAMEQPEPPRGHIMLARAHLHEAAPAGALQHAG